jgi:hypothetical protein
MMKRHAMTDRVKRLTGSRKREFNFDPEREIVNVDSYWDGGSKSDYVVFNIDTGLTVFPKGNAPFVASGRLGYKLITGDILIETGTMCGKPATPMLMCKVEDSERVQAYLGIPANEPNPNAGIVQVAPKGRW